MIEQINSNVWKIANDSNIYYLKKEKILIDCGNRRFLAEIQKDIKELFNPDEIKKVIFTHLHYDHVGCVDLFPNAEFYASSIEIKNYKRNPLFLVVNPRIMLLLRKIELKPLKTLQGFKIIETPGHTAGGISILYGKLLFSGDTLFRNGFGRVDLPTSNPHDMDESLAKLKKLDYDVLCPGHDY